MDDAEVTDLRVLVEAIRRANDELGLPPQHSPWLPALTTDVQLDDLLAGLPVPVAGYPDDERVPAARLLPERPCHLEAIHPR